MRMLTKKYWLRTDFSCYVSWKDKHHDYVFLADDNDDLFRILYEIFCLADNQGYYSSVEENKDQKTWYDKIKNNDSLTDVYQEL